MSASPVLVPEVPALPDDHQLSQQLEHRPNWVDLFARIDGLTGKQLFEMGEFGKLELEQITDMDTQVKLYKDLFLEWYWKSPFGAVEKAADQFKKGIRFAEVNRCEDFRGKVSTISGGFTLAGRQEALRRKAEQEAEQARIAAEDKQRRLAQLEQEKVAATPEKAGELDAAIEQEKQAELIPSAVSLAQASVGLPQAPKTISATAVYGRTVTDWPKFLRGLADNPALIGVLKLSVNFTPFKYRDTPIPGVKVEQLPDKVANRSK